MNQDTKNMKFAMVDAYGGGDYSTMHVLAEYSKYTIRQSAER